jgi:hypothetical protein
VSGWSLITDTSRPELLVFPNANFLTPNTFLGRSMRSFALAVCLMGLGMAGAEAQDRKFPYDAVVDVDEELARCGPGPKYYPTSKVKRGEKVSVHRHDPGGWSMIAPPAGSFSWVQSEYVQRLASGKGTLTANNVVAHVGSSLGDDRGVYQRTLSKGDTVEIIGEATVTTERGPVAMYKIKPPAREFRWIPGKALVPAKDARGAPPGNKLRLPLEPAPSVSGPIALEFDDSQSPTGEPDPFGPQPTEPMESESGNIPTLPKLGQEPSETPPLMGAINAPPESLDGLRKQLESLDRKLKDTLRQEPQSWDLASIEQEYQRLDQAANHPAFHAHVQQRLYSLKRYNKVRQDYVDFFQLTAETKQRDAQLLSMQRQHEEQLKALQTAAPTPNGMSTPQQSPTPLSGAPGSLPPGAQPSSPPPPGASPKFVGAGIVQRLNSPPADGPQYALVTPDGRLLAYLEPTPGLDLTPAVNQALGIQGQRGYREDLKADLIVVRGYQPVTLRTK